MFINANYSGEIARFDSAALWTMVLGIVIGMFLTFAV
jgi:hypothetical protein